MVIYSGVCYTQRKFFGDKDAYKMNSERLMNEQRLALLKTIRKENPSLRRYMNDIINEMENPESAFNTGKMTQPTDLDRTTAMRLCDAFAVAKMYSEKYHLDFPELIEFVSEKTLEILADEKITLTAPFKERMKYLIRQQFPFRNALLSRSGRRNIFSYELADKEIWCNCVDEKENSYSNENPELETPILYTNNANISYSKMEFGLELKEDQEEIARALKSLTPREEKVIRCRFGLDDRTFKTLEEVGRILGKSRTWVGYTEHHAIRKLHSRKCLSILNGLSEHDEICSTPIGRGTFTKKSLNNHPAKNNFDIFIYWQPYCTCKHQMQYRMPALVDGKWKAVFYCLNCGKIYKVKNGELKKIEGYALKGYSSCSPYIEDKWPIFHWDKNEKKGFDRRFKRFKIRRDIQYYTKQLQQCYGENCELLKVKESKIISIYDLASKNIMSIDAAYEACKNILNPENLVN